MGRLSGLLVFFLFSASSLLPAPARAAIASGGGWELEKSAVGASFNSRLTGGNLESAQSISTPFGELRIYSGGNILGGYLSQIPSERLVPSIVTIISSGAVVSGGMALGMAPSAPMSVVFTNEMSSTTLLANVIVRAIYDRLGNVINSTWAFNLVYSTGMKQAFITDAGAGWPKGMLFEIIVTTNVLDFNGVPINVERRLHFTPIRDHLLENVVLPLDFPSASVRLPANAYGLDYSLALSTDALGEAVANADRKILGVLGPGSGMVRYLKIEPFDASGNPVVENLAVNATLTLPFTDNDGDGIVDGTDIRIKTLSVFWLDEVGQRWVRQNGSSVDAANNRLLYTTGHFSTFAVIGALDTDVSNVYAFPVPFRPNSGNVARYGSWSTGITFTWLPSAGRIRIYTVTGRLVRELSIAGNEKKWDVKNVSGQVVASGLYIWEVVSGENRRTGKLMIIK